MSKRIIVSLSTALLILVAAILAFKYFSSPQEEYTPIPPGKGHPDNISMVYMIDGLP